MEHQVGALHEPGNQFAVPDIAFDQPDFPRLKRAREVRAPTADKVVYDRDFLSARGDQLVHHGRTDGSRAPGDEALASLGHSTSHPKWYGGLPNAPSDGLYVYPGTVIHRALRGRLEKSQHPETEHGVGQWCPFLVDRTRELAHDVAESLSLGQCRSVHVAEPVGDQRLPAFVGPEGLRRDEIDAAIMDHDSGDRIHVVPVS